MALLGDKPMDSKSEQGQSTNSGKRLNQLNMPLESDGSGPNLLLRLSFIFGQRFNISTLNRQILQNKCVNSVLLCLNSRKMNSNR